MNFKRIKTTAAAGILAASMILPNMTAFAAQNADGGVDTAQIVKTVQMDANATSIPEADKNITFLVHQVANASTNAAPSTVNDATVTIDASTASGASTEFAEAILADVSGLKTGEYTFEVTETLQASTTDFGWTSVNTAASTYYLRVVVKADNSKLYFITASNEAGATKLGSAAFTNVYNKKSVGENDAANTLNVQAIVKDEDKGYVSTENVYPVTVTFTAPTTQNGINDSFKASVDGVALQGSVNGNTITFTVDLKADQSIVITDIAVGSTYEVTEGTPNIGGVNDANFAKNVYYINGNNTSVDACANQTFAEESQTVVVESDFNNITITGVVTDIAPYVTLVVVAVAAIAAYLGLKKRVAR